MVIVNQSQITEATFNKWKAHKVDVEEDDGQYSYYVIPLIDVDQFNVSMLEKIPALYSSYSDEFTDDDGNVVFTIRLDTQLPEMTTEQEVELLYKILTKKSLRIE